MQKIYSRIKGLDCCSDTSISFHKPFDDIIIFSEILKKTNGAMTNFNNFVDLYYKYKNVSRPSFTTTTTTTATTTTATYTST